ncbi:MAG TPA: hypothetical protein VJZ70_02300 [Limnochordia bacterium]|jgi:hypothetical protein|nr:hypothetical protein [Limnochordia bacterium]
MQRAKAWLMRYGRPLELARWEFFFEQGSKDTVIHYLQAFQNDDGGFGHGLEPDFWLPASSPMATWMAGQILVEVGASLKDSIVQHLVSYLINTPQVQPGMWPSVLPENNLYPHAPWWRWEEDAQASWMFNPSVELAAFLIHWSPTKSDGTQLGWESLLYAIRHVMQVTHMERHELNNYIKCLRLLKAHEEYFDSAMGYSFAEVEEQVQTLTKKVIDRDHTNWGTGYKPLPLDFIQSPDDPLLPELQELVEENLRFYLDQRTDEGVWPITWTWGQYPEEFAVASRYWQGVLAVERCKILQAFEKESS